METYHWKKKIVSLPAQSCSQHKRQAYLDIQPSEKDLQIERTGILTEPYRKVKLQKTNKTRTKKQPNNNTTTCKTKHQSKKQSLGNLISAFFDIHVYQRRTVTAQGRYCTLDRYATLHLLASVALPGPGFNLYILSILDDDNTSNMDATTSFECCSKPWWQ